MQPTRMIEDKEFQATEIKTLIEIKILADPNAYCYSVVPDRDSNDVCVADAVTEILRKYKGAWRRLAD